MRLLILFILASFLSPLQAATNVSAAGTLSKDGETYTLLQNITANGTAFTVSGNNITFDLNGNTITYNNTSAGPGIVVSGSNNTITNGYIVQGANRSGTSPAVMVTGSGSSNTISYLGIKVDGHVAGQDNYAAGVETYSAKTTVDHVFIENNGDTSDTSYSPRGIHADNRTTAGFTFNDNIILGSHLGISLTFVGLSTETPQKSNIYNNYIQHRRIPGTKAPYGIQLAKTRNVNIYNNQIVTDNGRGIMCDGFGQNVARGTDKNNIYNNRIDVEYRESATSGAYVENNLYGIRDRYSSGENHFYNNTIMVKNGINRSGTISTGIFVGSDGTDAKMFDLEVTDNTIIADHINGSASAVYYGYSHEITVTGNDYIADAFSDEEYVFGNNGGTSKIPSFTENNNNPISKQNYTPAKVTGLALRKFFGNYVLTWNDNAESQTLEYVVYRDGTPLDISTRGGTFYIDTVSGTHSYTVAAKNLNGNTGAQSNAVSTSSATLGWGLLAASTKPKPPQNVYVQLN